jgi:hypothetical protein
VDRPTLNLMPDTSAEATIRFSPPRTSRVRSGPNPADIAVRSHEHPDASVVERIEVVVAPFVEFETNLAPSVLRGSQAATTTLRASNSGNAPVELSLSAEDPEMAFEFGISPSTLRVEPGATADASVVVTPREALRSGTDRTRPFRVLAASGDGARRSLDGTFIQVVTRRPRWRLAFALLGLLGIVIVGIGLVDLLRGGGGGDGATPTPATPSTEVSPSTEMSPAALPDLQIAAVETFPQEPSAGKRFTLNVYITNRGQAPSGDYDLWMTIVDVNRGNKYPIGTFREASMQPGEQVAAFTTQDAMVNEPGPFEVRVGIDPFLFEDGNPGNNTMVHTFNVLPRP